MRRYLTALVMAALGSAAFAAGAPAPAEEPEEKTEAPENLAPLEDAAPVVLMEVPKTRPVLDGDLLDRMREKLAAQVNPQPEETGSDQAEKPASGH